MTDAGAAVRRVALLARPGAAADRLRDALGGIGVTPVLSADPLATEPGALAEAAPDVLVVVLDPVVEDALERFDAVLADPGIDVLFEEADLAVAREGWDAARWARHLSAKLLRHGDVLPPGTEPGPGDDDDSLPGPGRPPSPAHLSEPGLEAFDLAGATDLATGIPEATRFDPVAAEYDAADDAGPADASGFEFEDTRAAWARDAAVDDVAEDAMAERVDASDRADAEVDAGTPAAPASAGLTLSLAEHDAPASPATHAPTADRQPRARDLADIERRIAAFALEDGPDAGTTPSDGGAVHASGAVLVLAGIGGPDAVRQFIGGLPAGFPRPVLVQQRLDGARHDRLVQQMSRATSLPVELAEAGRDARPGTVYILPPDVTIAPGGAGIAFAAGDAGTAIDALPAADSAVLVFSGSDAGLVEAAMRLAGDGAYVAGQTPGECYDAAAPEAVVAGGGPSGRPAELAQQLVARWNA